MSTSTPRFFSYQYRATRSVRISPARQSGVSTSGRAAPRFWGLTLALLACTVYGAEAEKQLAIRVASISFEPVQFDLAGNTDKLDGHFRKAAAGGARLAVAPEGILEGYVVNEIITGQVTAERMREVAIQMDSPTIRRFQSLARELELCLVFGFAESIGDDVFNSAVFIDGEGRICGKYHKMQLAEGYDDNWWFNRLGQRSRAFDTPLGRCGILLGNDRWNPQLSQVLALDGAQFLVIPSFGSKSQKQDKAALARGVETGLPVIETNVGACLVVSENQIVAVDRHLEGITFADITIPPLSGIDASRRDQVEAEFLTWRNDEMPRRLARRKAELRVGYECRWATSPIQVDGKDDELVWAAAQTVDGFRMPWLGEMSAPPLNRTRAKLLWDRENFYFYADLEDDDLFADIDQHDGRLWDNDVFGVFLKPAQDRPGFYEFQVNAMGARLDIFRPDRAAGGYQRFKSNQPFHFETVVVCRGSLNEHHDDDQGWSVEGRIPWHDFVRTGARPEPDETWDFALCRYDYSLNRSQPEMSTCAPLGKADFCRHEDYASLQFVGPTPVASPLPAWDTSRVTGSPDPPPPYRVRRVYPQLPLDYPICIRYVPGSDQMLVIDSDQYNRSPQLLQVQDKPDVDTYTVLIDYENVPFSAHEVIKGLAYDIEFHPQFKQNGFVYIGSNVPDGSGGHESRITRYKMQTTPPYRFDVDSGEIIIRWPSFGHDGAAIAFGREGMMYVTSGDGSGGYDEDQVGQRLDTLLSKVLRIDVDSPAAGQAYRVPPDNPFVGVSGARPETWAYGLRNPWRIAVDPKTGHVWVGNNGQDLWEQIYLVEKGANYGWSAYEGSHPYYPNRPRGPTPIRWPTLEHHHAEAQSLTGGQVYHGQDLPELTGAYIYGDFSTGRIWAARHNGEQLLWHREIADTKLRISCFALDRRGELVITDHRGSDEGGIYRLEPNPQPDTSRDFPRFLSQTGLFHSVSEYLPHPGLLAYSVNVPGWHDGALMDRHLGLSAITDSEGASGREGEHQNPRIGFSPDRAWEFPDGTVFMQTLTLELHQGHPESRRKVETRLLTRQAEEWAGYSYLWNDEQTDAQLVRSGGSRKTFTIRGENEERQQIWRIPSRTDCMSCHSRQAGHVLGFTTLQLNCPHPSSPNQQNQLRILESMNLLRVDTYAIAKQTWRDEVHAELIHKETGGGKKVIAANLYSRIENDTNERLRAITDFQGQREPRDSVLLYPSVATCARLPRLDDEAVDLHTRARAYLHVNCACCHIGTGGGNSKLRVAFGHDDARTNMIDTRPLQGEFGLRDVRLVAPGAPHRSVLNYRMSVVSGGRMPRVGSHQIDPTGLRLIRRWISRLDSDDKSDPVPRAVSCLLEAGAQTANPIIAKLLATPDGALALVELLDEYRLAPSQRQTIIDLGTVHENPSVRRLFERFIPEEQRTVRLGTHIDPMWILRLDGDASDGQRLFFKDDRLACSKCHQLQQRGHAVGPDLSGVGQRYRRSELLESLLEPSAKIEEKYATWAVITGDGKVHLGILAERTDEGVVLKQASGELVRIASDDVEETVRQSRSMMPDHMLQDFTAQQVADLLAFLKSLVDQ